MSAYIHIYWYALITFWSSGFSFISFSVSVSSPYKYATSLKNRSDIADFLDIYSSDFTTEPYFSATISRSIG